MKEEEFEALRQWGEALSRDGRSEVAAAGKAIEILVAEIDRLEIELWHARVGIARQPAEGAAPEETDSAPPQLDAELDAELEAEVRTARSRVRRLLLSPRARRSSVSPPS